MREGETKHISSQDSIRISGICGLILRCLENQDSLQTPVFTVHPGGSNPVFREELV